MKKLIVFIALVLVGCGSVRKNTQINQEQITEVSTLLSKESVESSKEVSTFSNSSASEIELWYEAKKDSVGNYVPLVYTEVSGGKTLREIVIDGPGMVRVRNLQSNQNQTLATSETKKAVLESAQKAEVKSKQTQKQVQRKRAFPWWIVFVAAGVMLLFWLKKRVTP